MPASERYRWQRVDDTQPWPPLGNVLDGAELNARSDEREHAAAPSRTAVSTAGSVESINLCSSTSAVICTNAENHMANRARRERRALCTLPTSASSCCAGTKSKSSPVRTGVGADGRCARVPSRTTFSPISGSILLKEGTFFALKTQATRTAPVDIPDTNDRGR
jgi:hypothetical protein